MINKLLAKENMTIEDLALEIGVDRKDLQLWLTKGRLDEMPINVLKKIARRFGVPAGEIYMESGY